MNCECDKKITEILFKIVWGILVAIGFFGLIGLLISGGMIMDLVCRS